MELITKILSSNFFSIFTDMIKINNSWKSDGMPKEKLDFSWFVKKRLLLLAKFQFKPIKNFNLSLCLRLQFLLQNHLVACLDEKSLQVYSQYLCKENKKLIFSIIQNDRNFEVIIKELYTQNYAHLEFLIEIFYSLKNNIDSFVKIQAILQSLGFMDFLSGLINQMDFKSVDGSIFLDIKSQYFSEKANFLSLLELIMFFIYRNKTGLILKIFPNSSSVSKSSLLPFLFTLLFQESFLKSNTFVLRILEIIVSNIKEVVDEPEIYRQDFADAFSDVIEQYNLFSHAGFFQVLEMLIHNKEDTTLKMILVRIDVWPHILNNMNFSGHKTLCTTIVKLTSYLLTKIEHMPSDDILITIVLLWFKYLQKNKYNVLSSCIFEALETVYNKYADYVQKVFTVSEYAIFQSFLKPTVSDSCNLC